MEKLETTLIDGKIYITNVETEKLFYEIPSLIEVFIPKNIEIIEEEAFFENDLTYRVSYSKNIIFEGNKENILIKKRAFERYSEMPLG